jgi:DNA-binding transcriptional ArsR family regulator
MSQQITIEVSEQVMQQAMRVAAHTKCSLEEVLALWLEYAVAEPPFCDLSDAEVLALTELQLTDEQQATLSQLLAQNQEGTLAAEGQKQLDELMRLYEHGLLRKSQALRVAVQRELIAPLQS